MSAVIESGAKVTTMDALRRPEAPEARMPMVKMGWNDLQGFELMQRAAKALSASTLVPQQYQGNLPNALIALEMAQRIGASPLMVMQNLYIVHGRPGWSSKFLIASFNQCGRFSAVRYEWGGTRGKDDWSCKAYAVEKATGERIEGPVITIGLSKEEGWYNKSGSKWKTIPELMLMYRAAGWMINTHAPEISMGLNTVEELGDVFDARADQDGQFRVITDDLRQVDEVAQPPETPAPITDQPGLDAAPITVATAIDRISKAEDEELLCLYVDSLPDALKADSEIGKAFKKRQDELKKK